jgi:hypothetical protein
MLPGTDEMRYNLRRPRVRQQKLRRLRQRLPRINSVLSGGDVHGMPGRHGELQRCLH